MDIDKIDIIMDKPLKRVDGETKVVSIEEEFENEII